MNEPDEYDLFLQTWEPGERLVHASLSQNLDDPFSRKRLFDDSTGSAPVARTPFSQGRRNRAHELGASNFITKPVDFDQLKQQLRGFASRSG
jgi:hypothetical protein